MTLRRSFLVLLVIVAGLGCGGKDLKDQLQGRWVFQSVNQPFEVLEFKGGKMSTYMAEIPGRGPDTPSITVSGKKLWLYRTQDFKIEEGDLVVDQSNFYGRPHQFRTTTAVAEDGNSFYLHHKTSEGGILRPGTYVKTTSQ